MLVSGRVLCDWFPECCNQGQWFSMKLNWLAIVRGFPYSATSWGQSVWDNYTNAKRTWILCIILLTTCNWKNHSRNTTVSINWRPGPCAMNIGYLHVPPTPNHHLCHLTWCRPGRTRLHRACDRFAASITRRKSHGNWRGLSGSKRKNTTKQTKVWNMPMVHGWISIKNKMWYHFRKTSWVDHLVKCHLTLSDQVSREDINHLACLSCHLSWGPALCFRQHWCLEALTKKHELVIHMISWGGCAVVVARKTYMTAWWLLDMIWYSTTLTLQWIWVFKPKCLFQILFLESSHALLPMFGNPFKKLLPSTRKSFYPTRRTTWEECRIRHLSTMKQSTI